MAMNELEGLVQVLEAAGGSNTALLQECEIFVDEGLRVRAMKPLQRMLDFSADKAATANQ
jgi:quinolinate synthase